MNVPPISEDLLAFLDEVFPNRIPTTLGITPQEIGQLQGRLEVVEFLRGHYANQQEDSADVLLQAQNQEG